MTICCAKWPRSTINMVTESVDAYVKRDTMLAETVIAEDDVVDNATSTRSSAG